MRFCVCDCRAARVRFAWAADPVGPVEGAIGYRQIATRAGNDVLGILRTASGMPPLGARVQMADSGKDVGIVADEGHVWLGAVQPEQQFLVTWGDASQCRFTLPSHLTNLSQLMLPCQ